MQKLAQFFRRCSEEIGPIQTAACIALLVVIIGLIPAIVLAVIFSPGKPNATTKAAAVVQPVPDESPANEDDPGDTLSEMRKVAIRLAADPEVRKELQLRKNEFSPVTVTLANRGTLSDWMTLNNVSKAQISLYLAAKMHPDETPEDRSYRVILSVGLLNASAQNEAASDLLIDQAYRIHDKTVSNEITRSNWRPDVDL